MELYRVNFIGHSGLKLRPELSIRSDLFLIGVFDLSTDSYFRMPLKVSRIGVITEVIMTDDWVYQMDATKHLREAWKTGLPNYVYMTSRQKSTGELRNNPMGMLNIVWSPDTLTDLARREIEKLSHAAASYHAMSCDLIRTSSII